MFDDTNLSSQNRDFHVTSLKTWTWVPIVENHARTNTKHESSQKAFGSKHDFLEEHMNAIFSF